MPQEWSLYKWFFGTKFKHYSVGADYLHANVATVNDEILKDDRRFDDVTEKY